MVFNVGQQRNDKMTKVHVAEMQKIDECVEQQKRTGLAMSTLETIYSSNKSDKQWMSGGMVFIYMKRYYEKLKSYKYNKLGKGGIKTWK